MLECLRYVAYSINVFILTEQKHMFSTKQKPCFKKTITDVLIGYYDDDEDEKGGGYNDDGVDWSFDFDIG